MYRRWLLAMKTQRASSALLAASAVLVVGGWLWAYFALRHISQPLVVRFNNLTRITQIGSVSDLVPIGAFGVLLVFVNGLIAITVERRDWFWGRFYAAATFVLAGLIFIGFAAIIAVNL
jgi:hypothetical protein